jgi:2,4-dienoyl-CoA reductase (NADPH2)
MAAEASGFEKMFEPITIKGVKLRNRIAMAPLHTGFMRGPIIPEQLIAYYAERARHGVGMIVTSPVSGTVIRGMPQPPPLSSPAHVAGWNELVETVHAFGTAVFIQVMPGVGRQAARGLQTKAPSPLPLRIPEENLPAKATAFAKRKGLGNIWEMLMAGEMPLELTPDEVAAAEDSYAVSAGLAQRAGADGVELHFAHGYLGYSFLSPRTNFREDAYGGSTQNRQRFLLNVLAKVRQAVSDDFIVGIRISGSERMPGGLETAETVRILADAERAGLDFVHLTDGCFEAAKWYLPDEDGTMLEAAQAVKAALSIPVITPSIHDPVAAERALAEGQTDIVSLGRSILADSAWVSKVAEGRAGKIVRCIRCLTCLRRTRSGLHIRCEVNPRLGAERYSPENYRPNAPHPKSIHYPRMGPPR